jgi:hypothetical protein
MRKPDSGFTLIDLCAGTGSWSEPYLKAGYNVIRVTLPDNDVRLWRGYTSIKGDVGIIAAPPCTHFSVSGARWWEQKGDSAVIDGLSVVDACLRIIRYFEQAGRLRFWALENPVGRLKHWIGAPLWTFQPYEYGDPWVKRTCIWGIHNLPLKRPVKITGKEGRIPSSKLDHPEYLRPDWVHRLPPSKDRAMLRSITPPGFAQAFFEANH